MCANVLPYDQWLSAIWPGVTWPGSGSEVEEYDLGIVEPDHDDTPHETGDSSVKEVAMTLLRETRGAV